MQTRLVTPTKQSPFVPEIENYQGNQSGIAPVGTKVLIQTDAIKAVTVGGIHLPEIEIEKQSLAVTTGWLVGMGGGAFTNWPASDDRWPGRTPKEGDRVWIAKYSGLLVRGDDGRAYRLCNDTDIAGIKL